MNGTTPPRQTIRRVLVVDDDYDLAQLLREVLTYDNCDVEIATNGMEAMERLHAGEFDVVICDLMMPRVDGEALYNDVARQFPFLANRFVFVTGQASLKAGFGDFVARTGNVVIEKPFDLAVFRAAVQGAIQRES
jgi:CheY-like chemotaxis protein